MPTNSFPLVQFRVSSPYLKNPPTSDATTTSYESNRREFRKSLERIERINMNDLEPFQQQSRPDAAELRGVFSKRQNRLSREILGVDDPVLSAPDNAPTITTLQPNKQQQQQSHLEHNQKNLVLVNSNSELDDDAGSAIMAGSVTSTVPDRYGFVGGNQYTHYDTERY